MTRSLLFWVLMLLAVVLGFYSNYGQAVHYAYTSAGMTLLELVLFALLGWQVYGPALKG